MYCTNWNPANCYFKIHCTKIKDIVETVQMHKKLPSPISVLIQYSLKRFQQKRGKKNKPIIFQPTGLHSKFANFIYVLKQQV